MSGLGLARIGVLFLGLAASSAPAQEARPPLRMYYVPFAAQNLGAVRVGDLPRKVRPFFEFTKEEDIAWLRGIVEKQEVKDRFKFSLNAIRIQIEQGAMTWCVDDEGNVLRSDFRCFRLNPIEATRSIESRKTYVDFISGK